MATYGFLDMFLGFSGFAFMTWGLVSLIFHWEALFQEVRDSCKGRIAHPKRCRLLWLVSLTIATWFLAAVTYVRDISVVWNLMRISQREDSGRGFADVVTQTYFFVLVICGTLGFSFTSWFLYHNRHELPSLIMIIRFDAGEYHSVGDLENGRNARRETKADGSPSNSVARPTEAQVDLSQWPGFNNEGDALHLTPSSSRSDAQINTRITRPPTFDNWYAPPDTESCSSCDSEYIRTIPCTRPAKHREPLTPTSPIAPLAPFASDADADADAENTDAHPQRRPDLKRKRGNGRYVREWLESEIPPLCQGDECRCARPDRIRTHREVLNELVEERSGAGERARRSWEDALGYVAGVEDNDDGEESDDSDDVEVRRLEGADSEAWKDEHRSSSYGLTQEQQGILLGREDIGPLDNVQEPNYQTTSAQEQRPWLTGDTFFPPGLPVRRPRGSNIIADERGHGQRPSPVEIPRDVIRRLRITIPTQRPLYAEPRAPTTPVNTHSLAEWPTRASAGND